MTAADLAAVARDPARRAAADLVTSLPPAPAVWCSGLRKRYGRQAAVEDVSLEVGRGEVVGLLGPNGAGKTTTFYMVVGLIRPDRGRVYLDDRELTQTPMYRRARMGVGYLAQEPSIFRKLTVE